MVRYKTPWWLWYICSVLFGFFYLIIIKKYANKIYYQIVCLCLNSLANTFLFFYLAGFQRYIGFPEELCIWGVDKFSASELGGCHGNAYEVHTLDIVGPLPVMVYNHTQIFCGRLASSIVSKKYDVDKFSVLYGFLAFSFIFISMQIRSLTCSSTFMSMS